MIRPSNKKYKFINGIWVTGFYNNLEIIGRTCLVDKEEMVTVITENANSMLISYHEIVGLSKISVTKHIEQKREKIEHETFSSDLNNLLASRNIKYDYQRN